MRVDDSSNMMSRMIYHASIHWRHEVKRYDYHHGPSLSTIDRNNGDDYFRVTLRLMDCSAERSVVSYLLPIEIYNARHFPLRELVYTFAEQVGVHIQQLEFRHENGSLLPMMVATPDSLGMKINEDFTIVVSIITSNHNKRTRVFKRLNRLGKVKIEIASHQGGDAFGSDLLPRILEFAGIDFLESACRVCRHWFHVSQRYSVLVQLQDGYTDTWQIGQHYPILLHDKCRPAFDHYLAQLQELMGLASSPNSSETIRIGSTMIQKERTQSHAFGYCKGAGCRGYKTVSMETISSDLDTKWEELHKARTVFVEYIARQSKYEVHEGAQKDDAAVPKRPTTTTLRTEIANRISSVGLCPHCGVKTHSTSIFRTSPLTNDNVYEGTCIRCNLMMIPTKVLVDLGFLIPRDRMMTTTTTEQQHQQEFPPKGEAGNGFIAEANDWRYRKCAVELYRRFFGPDMKQIFPLIVNKETTAGAGSGGLDFRTCTTSLVFGTLPTAGTGGRRRSLTKQEKILERMLFRNSQLSSTRPNLLPSWLIRPCDGWKGPPPLGSVSWRIHDAEDIAAKALGLDVGRRQQQQHMQSNNNQQETTMAMQNDSTSINNNALTMINGPKPQIILEILFLAVWDPFRGANYGSALVTNLESQIVTYAKTIGHKSALMYVEIGFEQPLARKFWMENGFAPIVSAAAAHQERKGQRSLVENALPGRMLKVEDWQLGFIDRRCLRFKDTEQYAKRILVD